MRRVHLRGRSNILKRLLIHVGGLNLGLLMRSLCGKGTPRGWPGSRPAGLAALQLAFLFLLGSLSQETAGQQE